MSKTKTIFITLAAVLLTLTGPNKLAYAATGAETYKAKCAMCHSADGSGKTPLGERMKVRDLRSAEVQKQSTETLTGIITNGQKAMPAFGKTLDGLTIDELVGFVRSIAAK